MNDSQTIELDSHEEFMLVGQRPGHLIDNSEMEREFVLIKSRGASVELLGAIRSSESGNRFHLSSEEDNIQLIRTPPKLPPSSSTATRPSEYVFVWRGMITSFEYYERLQKILERNLPDILASIDRGRDQTVESALSEVIYALAAGPRDRRTVDSRQPRTLPPWIYSRALPLLIFFSALVVLSLLGIFVTIFLLAQSVSQLIAVVARMASQ